VIAGTPFEEMEREKKKHIGWGRGKKKIAKKKEIDFWLYEDVPAGRLSRVKDKRNCKKKERGKELGGGRFGKTNARRE